jgi:type I restriction enzyme S subunit
VRYGLSLPPELKKDGIALIRATNIHKGTILEKNMIFVNLNEVPKKRNAFLQSNEVIVVRSGAYTGDVAQVTKKWEGAIIGYDLVVNPGEKFTGEFLESYLLTPFIQNNYFENLKARAGQPHLNSAQLNNTPIILPPIELQNQFSSQVNQIRNVNNTIKNISEKLNILFSIILDKSFSGNLTKSWREAHAKELLAEMEQQQKYLNEKIKSLKG